jgi:uncharacterized membrane protein
MKRTSRRSLELLAILFFVGQSWLLRAQSSPSAGEREAWRPFGLHQTRGSRVNSRFVNHEIATAATQPEAVAPGLAPTKVYEFRSVDYPGASDSFLQDYNEKVAVGNYDEPHTGSAFYFDGTSYRILKVPHTKGSIIDSINTSGQMVGLCVTSSGQLRGFFYNGTSFTILNFPHSHGTYANGINDSGLIVGSYFDSNNASHGFRYKAGVFTRIDFPGGTQTVAWGINSTGDIVGSYSVSGGGNGFLLKKGVYYPIAFPQAKDTGANGINDAGAIAGYYHDTTGQHGFIYSGGDFTQVDVPGAAGTTLYRIKNNGSVVGYLLDSQGEVHGFLGH